jgi:flagella basal body P-ring formation protein FlgA
MKLLMAGAMVLGLTSASLGQVIRLKSSVAVEPRQDVRLGDIATVSGVDARRTEELSNTVILSEVQGPEKVKAESVLMALMAQKGAEGLGGNLQISGAAVCDISLAGTRVMTVSVPVVAAAGVSGPPLQANMPLSSTPVVTASVMPAAVVTPTAAPAAQPAKVAENPVVTPSATAAAGGTPAAGEGTLRQTVINCLLKELDIKAEQLLVDFDSINPLIDRPLTAGQKWACRPMTRTFLGTVQFESQLTQGTKVVEKFNLVTQVKQRQMVVVSTDQLEKRHVITESDVRMTEILLDRKLPTLFTSMKEAVGLELQRNLDVGSPLDKRDFKPSVMAHKNDQVTVLYVAGMLQIQLQGRAMEDAKLHEQVTVRNEVTGQEYPAVFIAHGYAIVGGTLTAEQEQQFREAHP